ncbi:MAG: molybdopterin molybdotransferase MoeA [Candidatus Latescibacterota bacterium]|nr:MAG: molybdopterin molybdotransferase MoeA [Candidatus Latescibacterota bacterium]
MISLETAISILQDKIRGRVPTETIPVREAAGRILAADQKSKVNLPPFDKSAMDGYAILEDDPSETYRVVGVVSAGEPGIDKLEPGTTVKVMTGAPVPPGVGKVVMIEQAVEKDGYVQFEKPSASRHICKKAEDIAVGDTIVKAGARVGPLEISNLTGCGISTVEVSKPVRAAVIATGDELVDSPSDLGPGKIMNTNGPLLCELTRRWGLDVTLSEVLPDDPPKLTKAIQNALTRADIVLVSGGVSVGDFDYVPDAIRQCGLEIHISRVATKPGKPLTFATGEKGILFGLPGNPVAVYVTFHVYVLRAVGLLTGWTYEPKVFKIRLAKERRQKPGDRLAFVPSRITAEGLAEPVVYHGSAHINAVMGADGFLMIPAGIERLPAGAELKMMTFEEWSR